MKRYLLAAAFMAAALSPVSAFAGLNIFISPPPIPVPVPPVPQARVVVVPPMPPGVVITPGPPSYWFWNSGRSEWFYYDRYRHPHYVRGHVFRNDGRHFYLSHGRWMRARHDMGRHRGWRRHGRREDREDWRKDRGRWHGHHHEHERWKRDNGD